MHEWALAEAIIDLGLKLAQEKKLREVREFYIKIGEIQQIDLETLDFALKELSKETPIEGAKISYNIHPAVVRCNLCGHKWKYKETLESLTEEEKEAIHFIPETIHVYVCCPKCGSRDFDIEEGRGVWIEEIK